MTSRGLIGILFERVCESTGVLCDEAGDCSPRRGNFRGVCPVLKSFSTRNRAAETYLMHAYIAWTGSDRLKKPVCFSDTV